MTIHLVTGATGFIGSALILELLSDPEAEVVCVARSKRPGQSPEGRLVQKLTFAAECYDQTDRLDRLDERMRVLEGDILDHECRWFDSLQQVDEVWHAAASLKFSEADQDEIDAHNIAGTQAMLAGAKRNGVSNFNYVSTAYVVGSQTGRIMEELVENDELANNAYERSKIRAERLVASEEDLFTRIMRPSIVVGDSVSRAAMSHVGLYGFIRGLLSLKQEVEERLGAFLSVRPLRLHARPNARINFVPIDRVVKAAVAIAHSDSKQRVFHLANSEPPTIATTSKAVFPVVGMKPPRLVESDDEFTSIDREFNDDSRTRFFRDYISHDRIFDVTNTVAAAGSDVLSAPLSEVALEEYSRWYLEYLAQRVADASST